MGVALQLNICGRVMRAAGDLEESEKYFRKSLEIAKSLKEQSGLVAAVKNNLGELFLERGDLPQSQLFLTAALESSQKDNDIPNLALAFQNLGGLALRQNNQRAAIEFFGSSLELQRQIFPDTHPEIAMSLAFIGHAKSELGEHEEAIDLYSAAEEIFLRHYDESHPTIFGMQGLKASLLWKLKDYDRCEKYLRASLENSIKHGGELTRDAAERLQSLGMVLYMKDPKNIDLSIKFIDKAINQLTQIRGEDFIGLATFHENAGLLSLREKRYSIGLSHFDRSQRISVKQAKLILPRLNDAQSAKFHRFFRRRFQTALGAPLFTPNDQAAFNKSAEWIINNKSLLEESLARKEQILKSERAGLKAPELQRLNAINAQLGRLTGEYCQPDGSQDLKAKIQKLVEEKNALIGAFVHKAPDPGSEWIELGEVRRELPAKSMLVEIAKVQSNIERKLNSESPGARYLAWIVSPEKSEVEFIDLGDAEEIDALVNQVREKIASDYAEYQRLAKTGFDIEKKTSEYKQLSQTLSEKILWPLLDKNKGVERVILSPDSNLWLAPWSALILPDGESYLVEKLHLQHISSSRYLLGNEEARQHGGPPVIFADPNFGKASSSTSSTRGSLGHFGKLTHSDKEAHFIKGNIKRYCRGNDPQLLLDDRANEAAAKQLQSPHVLVFSTHGFFQKDPEIDFENWQTLQNELDKTIAISEFVNPLDRCGLVLAGYYKNHDTESTLSDGTLTGGEIASLSLQHTDLVVLSACQTGVGTVVNGRGVASLQQAFHMAGARSVLGTLWNTDDWTSALIMKSFFQNLTEGVDRFEALKQAQVEYISKRKENAEPAHPAFWAPFYITGY